MPSLMFWVHVGVEPAGLGRPMAYVGVESAGPGQPGHTGGQRQQTRECRLAGGHPEMPFRAFERHRVATPR